MPQSQRHETDISRSALTTREKRYKMNVSAALHSLKDRIGHAARQEAVPSRPSSRATEATSQPIVSVEQSTVTSDLNGSSTRSTRAQQTSFIKSFCSICLDLNRFYAVAQSSALELYSATAQYETSSRTGCKGCTTVVRFLSEHSATGAVLGPPRDNETTYARLRALLTLYHTSKCMPVDKHVGIYVEISSYPNRPTGWWGTKKTSPISGDTGSDQAVAWARSELHDCMSQHGACIYTGCNVLPTRILRIDGPKDVRLHVTANQVSDYVCLSHCWGTLPLITTTSSNLEQFQQQIPWERLSKTFQDAISFTHRLGYMYIWIDSLCIVQDSAEDWRHEGSKMADIYRHSTLTLAATSSSDSNGGCFVKTPGGHRSRKWIFRDVTNASYEIHTRSSLDHSRFMHWTLPLSTRAWAFQERLLSPRILHFTKNELIWECSECIHCECSSIHDSQWNVTTKTTSRPNLWRHEQLSEVDRQWQDIVSTYRYKHLTYDKDIFPALQGLAKMIPDRMGPYLAGLWWSTLGLNLTWYVPRFVHESRLEEWRAPSWSWASSANPIGWTNKNHPPDSWSRVTGISVLDAKVSAVGDDATGEIVSGEVCIRGRSLYGKLHACDRHQSSQLPSLKFYSADGLVIYVFEDGEIQTQSYYAPGWDSKTRTFPDCDSDVHTQSEHLTGWESKTKIFWDHDITTAGRKHVPCRTVVLALRVEKFKHERLERDTTAWLLLKHSDHDPDVFERIGLLHVNDSGIFERDISKPPILDQAIDGSPVMEFRII